MSRTIDIGAIPVAEGFWSRLRGLSWRAPERLGPGLLLPRCRSVHTVGMRSALDLVFLDRDRCVVALHEQVPPSRFGIRETEAESTLELPPGRARQLGIRPGARLRWRAI